MHPIPFLFYSFKSRGKKSSSYTIKKFKEVESALSRIEEGLSEQKNT